MWLLDKFLNKAIKRGRLVVTGEERQGMFGRAACEERRSSGRAQQAGDQYRHM